MGWLRAILDWLRRRRDRTEPEAFLQDGAAVYMQGTLTIPLKHTGLDVNSATESFPTTGFLKVFKNGADVTSQGTVAAMSGAAPNLKTSWTSGASFDLVASDVIEVQAVDAAGNAGAKTAIVVQFVDNQAPAQFAVDGTATFVPK